MVVKMRGVLRASVLFLVSVLAIAAFLAIGTSQAFAEEGEQSAETMAPTHSKALTSNGDGTYTLSLSVTGRASSSTTSNKADVIVIFDRSGSMGEDASETTYEEHPTGSYGLVNGRYVNLYRHTGGWGSGYSQIDNDTTSGTVYYRGSGSFAGYYEYTGTRYRAHTITGTRLSVAKSAVNSLAQQLLSNNTADDPDRVQLSLVTFSDTAATSLSGTTNLNTFQRTVNGIRANGGTNWEDALQKANDVQTREGADVHVIFVSDGNPTFRNTKGGGAYWGEDAEHGFWPNYYYGSGSSDNNGKNFRYALVQAQNIVNAGKAFYSVGTFGDASNMQDLATQSGAPASNYYDATDQSALNAAFANIINKITNALGYTKISIRDGITAMTSTALVSGQPEGFAYTRSGGSYGGGTPWDDAPQAMYDGSAVSWNLEDMVLEDGVTYTVSFRVWPSQEAYDLVADLNNGIKRYNDLTEEQKAQIVSVEGGYGLKTNTDTSVGYTQVETVTTSVLPEGAVQNPDGSYSYDGFTYTKNDDGTWTGRKETPGESAFENPDPMPLTNSKMTVAKAWNDSLDTGQRPENVTLRIKRDDDTYIDIILNGGNSWTKQIDVAPGLKADGEILEEGHDYTIEEVDADYHFELKADPFHPMIVDGVLNKNETGGATVTATNDLKGGLNITKAVTADEGLTAPDAKFSMTVTLTKPDGTPWTEGTYNGTIDDNDLSYLKYRIFHKDGTSTDKMMIKSGDVITLAAGESARIINVAAGTTYSVEETNIPSGFTLASTPAGTSGTINANSGPSVTFINNYSVSEMTASIPVTKKLSLPAGVDPKDHDITGKYTFTLTADGNAPLPATTSCTNPDADGGNMSFGDITYDKPGTYTYHVAETGSAPGVSNDPQSSKTVTVVVTDGGNGTLSAQVQGADGTAAAPSESTTFTNTYSVDEVTVAIPVTKSLTIPAGQTGPGSIAGKYTFTLSPENGAPMPAAGGEVVTNPNAGGGTVNFGNITYTAPGTYAYTITESGTVDGVANDAAAASGKRVSVEVTDNGDGTLNASIKGADSTAAEAKASTTFTNAYNATPAKASIPVKKVLSAAAGLTPPDITEKYTFTLSSSSGAPLPAATELKNPDADGGTATFGEISYTKVGTYNYTLSESGTVDGVTNDNSGSKNVIVTVTDNGRGALVAAVSSSAANPVTFTNTYAVNPVEATIPVTKVLDTGDFEGPSSIANAYTFKLTPQNGAPAASVSEVKNPDAAGGTASFGAISFTAPGTYTYVITESGTVAGVTNDEAATSGKTVTVEVEDKGDGTMSATVKGADGTGDNPSNTTFTNTYKAVPAKAKIPVTKFLSYDSVLTPPSIQDKYTFTLNAEAGTPMPETTSCTNPSATGGDMSFGDIAYDKPGTYTYTVTESGEVAGVTNDAVPTKTVTVEVKDKGDGTLSATVRGADSTGGEVSGNTTFTNTYAVKAAEASIPVAKALVVPEGLTGPDITEAYAFTLAAKDDAPLPETTVLKNPGATGGEVSFGKIEFTAPGTYIYTITEEGAVSGVTNDAAAAAGKTAIVEVTDNGDGTLSAEVKGADSTATEAKASTTFTNTYGVSPVKAAITAKKVLKNGELAQGAFNFTISAATEGAPMPVSPNAINAADGTVAFGDITFSKPGTYKYIVKEVAGAAGCYDYDTSEKPATVTVTDNMDGTMSASVEGGGASATFTNTYHAESGDVFLGAVKLVNGEAAPKDIFQFTISADDGGRLPEATTVTNNGGSVSFGPIKYDASIFEDIADGGDKVADAADDASAKVDATVDLGMISGAKISVQLLAGGKAVGEPVALEKDEGGAWKAHSWEGLDKLDESGKDIAYSATYKADEGESVPVPAERLSITEQETAPAADQKEDKAAKLTPRTKTYHYTIEEIAGSAPGYTYATDAVHATVTVTDDGSGNLVATTRYDGGNTFRNTYEAHDGAVVNAKKTLEGAALAEGQFTFGLFEGDEQVGVATNAADGSVEFDLAYDQGDAGTHRYTMRELVNAPQVGYTYDSSVKTACVTVTDNGDGTMATQVEYDGDMIFANSYDPLPVNVTLAATKVLDGAALQAGQFSFQAKDESGKVIRTASNKADGSIVLDGIGITAPGTYAYTVSEIPGKEKGITYDTKVATYVVSVEDADGQLVVTGITVDGAKDAQAVFTNVYAGQVNPPAEDTEIPPAANAGAYKEGMPLTGDGAGLPWLAFSVGVGAAVMAVALRGIRQSERGRIRGSHIAGRKHK